VQLGELCLVDFNAQTGLGWHFDGAIHKGDAAAHEEAVTIRKLFEGKALVSGVKALLAHIHDDIAWRQVMPPLAAFPSADRAQAVAGYDQVRGKRVA